MKTKDKVKKSMILVARFPGTWVRGFFPHYRSRQTADPNNGGLRYEN